MIFQGVRLRPIEAEDLPLLQRLFNEPQYNHDTMGWDFPVSMDQQAAWFGTLKNRKTEFRAMIETEAGETIGALTLSNIDYRNRTAVLGGGKVLEAYQSKGYATKAVMAMLEVVFGQMDLHCVETQYLDTQRASRRLFEKLGFTVEGTLRQRIFKNGRRHDVEVVSITAEEYRKTRELMLGGADRG